MLAARVNRSGQIVHPAAAVASETTSLFNGNPSYSEMQTEKVVRQAGRKVLRAIGGIGGLVRPIPDLKLCPFIARSGHVLKKW